MVNDELGIYYSKLKSTMFKIYGAKTWNLTKKSNRNRGKILGKSAGKMKTNYIRDSNDVEKLQGIMPDAPN
jgi:hypothetical protein